MNWAAVNNGAYDYAADTRGYTYGVILEYQSPEFGVRFGAVGFHCFTSRERRFWREPRFALAAALRRARNGLLNDDLWRTADKRVRAVVDGAS